MTIVDTLNLMSGLVVFALIIQKARSIIRNTKRRKEIDNEKRDDRSSNGSGREP